MRLSLPSCTKRAIKGQEQSKIISTVARLLNPRAGGDVFLQGKGNWPAEWSLPCTKMSPSAWKRWTRITYVRAYCRRFQVIGKSWNPKSPDLAWSFGITVWGASERMIGPVTQGSPSTCLSGSLGECVFTGHQKPPHPSTGTLICHQILPNSRFNNEWERGRHHYHIPGIPINREWKIKSHSQPGKHSMRRYITVQNQHSPIKPQLPVYWGLLCYQSRKNLDFSMHMAYAMHSALPIPTADGVRPRPDDLDVVPSWRGQQSSDGRRLEGWEHC